MRLASQVVLALAAVILAVGVLTSVRSGQAVAGRLAATLRLSLEFLLAAGLLRLGTLETLSALGVVAATVAVRQIIGYGLRLAVRAAHAQP